MEKIFEHANEQHVRAGVVYLNSEDKILYFDSAFTIAVTKNVLIDLFKKGILVVNDGTNFVRPSVLAVASGYASVSYTTVGASNTAETTTFYSEGYTAG